MPGVACPPVGPVGLGSPLSPVLCAAQTATLPISGHCACRSRPDPLPALVRSWCPIWAPDQVKAPRPRQGFWSPGPPSPGCRQGDKWLSQVPELPLCMHAPLLDPGGVLVARLCALRTAAFRPLETVGFPLSTSLRAILLSTTILISGLHHAACILVPSSSVRPLLGVHVDVTPDLLAKLSSGGTCTTGSHPLGNNNQFHGLSPNSKVSGFPWRDQCLVRPDWASELSGYASSPLGFLETQPHPVIF